MANESKVKTKTRAKEAAQPVKSSGYCVASGRAITSKKGILSDGDAVDGSCLGGGADALAAFVASGHIVKK